MKLLVGLGNPGKDYARNRHNVGFMALDAIAQAHGFAPWRNKFQGQVSEGMLGNEKCILLKPSTYMNESGRSAAEAVRFYKIGLDDVIVFHDELDLAPRKLRVKAGGGVAGHNGLKSLTRHIGNDYVRARIGIGHPGDKARVHSHVLKDFSKSEMEWVEPMVEAIAGAVPKLVEGNASSFMNDVAMAAGDADKPEKKSKPENNKGKRPSQRDLAKNTAAATDDKPAAPDTETGGPFARLKSLFGGKEH